MHGKYPAVYLPQHPMALSGGLARIHRIIAFEKFGGIPEGMHVHHIDNDRWNWVEDNLTLKTPSAHSKEHWPEFLGTFIGAGQTEEVACKVCGALFSVNFARRKRRVTCSVKCRLLWRTRVAWPEDEVLLGLYGSMPTSSIGRLLGVSDVCINKRVRAIAVRTGVEVTKFIRRPRAAPQALR